MQVARHSIKNNPVFYLQNQARPLHSSAHFYKILHKFA